ncbi:hypothetical protein EMIT0158MI4_150195 [Burkholderia ambifaria]
MAAQERGAGPDRLHPCADAGADPRAEDDRRRGSRALRGDRCGSCCGARARRVLMIGDQPGRSGAAAARKDRSDACRGISNRIAFKRSALFGRRGGCDSHRRSQQRHCRVSMP